MGDHLVATWPDLRATVSGLRSAPTHTSTRWCSRIVTSARDRVGRNRHRSLRPFCVQPASLDIRLDRFFRVFRSSRHAYIDLRARSTDITELVEVAETEAFILHPGEFVLGSTRERIRLSDDIVSRVEGKSSLGRLGSFIHSTAGSSTQRGTGTSRSSCRT